ncbi:hypothetical protein HGM15179_006506 [Zosterops borbonicus]|uniref:Uncharacterized protein n=1 Tax=Zosterops borbonicus TaxID=364589 RepID=A0A8K1GKD5_9PASS|nr:hypothetical protein HGM15179_006506 [Zosterops borbonicus]
MSMWADIYDREATKGSYPSEKGGEILHISNSPGGFLWTCSNRLISFLCWDHQKQKQNTRWDLLVKLCGSKPLVNQ